jgi:hypothetical protein
MRFLRAAVLATIPVAGLASAPLFERVLQPQPKPQSTAIATVDKLAITGEPVRAGVMYAALSGLQADIALGGSSCSDTVQTEPRQVRYTAGVQHTDNPDHITARERLEDESALLAALAEDGAAVSAEVERLSSQLAEQEQAVAELAARMAALSVDSNQAALATAAATERVEKSAAAAAELRRRSEARASLYAEISDLQGRLPELRAEASAQSAAVQGVDVVALRAEADHAGAVVAEKKEDVAAARKKVKRVPHSGVDAGDAREALRVAREDLAQAEARLSASQAAVSGAELRLERADETRRAALHATTALRRAQDDLSNALGHCEILSAEADKLPRLERRLGHRESEERQARLAMKRIASLHAQLDAQRVVTDGALRAQRHAWAAVLAGQQAQSAQIELVRDTLDDIPAQMSRSVRRDLDYSVENWTRTCEVFAWVSWEEPGGQQLTKRVQQQAVVLDAANKAYPEAGITADLREYGVLDSDLIAQADLALAGDIRALIVADALSDDDAEDTGP